jgi:hypothetical protein
MGLSATHIKNADRRDRLLLLAAIAQVLLTLLGAAGEALGLDRGMKSNTSKRRQLSLLNLPVYPGADPSARRTKRCVIIMPLILTPRSRTSSSLNESSGALSRAYAIGMRRSVSKHIAPHRQPPRGVASSEARYIRQDRLDTLAD